MMRSILLYLVVLGFSNGFTSVGQFRHPPTALNGLGDRFKKLINRNQDTIAVLDREEELSKVEETDMDVIKNVIASEDNKDTTSDVKSDVVTELSETQKLMKQVKESGVAGVISYALWELGFWTVSVPVCVFGYRELFGHWPDISNQEDVQKVGAEAFAFVNFARFAVPLRIGLALSTTPWIQANIVDKMKSKDESDVAKSEETE